MSSLHLAPTSEARQVAIGCAHDVFDEVVAVWSPSRTAFLALEDFPGYRHAFEVHRPAAVEHAVLLVCDGAAEPVLGSPWA